MKIRLVCILLCIGSLMMFAGGCNKSSSTLPVEEATIYGVQMDGKWGFIDKNGNMVVKPQYEIEKPDELPPQFSEGMAAVRQNGKWGYINTKGRIVIKPQYKEALDFSEGLAGVCVNGMWGFINKSGKVVIKPQYINRPRFHDGLAAVANSNEPDRWIFIDKTGKRVFELKHNPGAYTYNAPIFSQGLAAVTIDGIHWGYVDKGGKMVIEPNYSYASSFNEDLAFVSNDNTMCFIDKNGQMVLKYLGEFNPVMFHDGLADVNINGKYGFIDKTGRIVIQPKYQSASLFWDGLAGVEVAGQWGVIDKNGSMIIQPKYDFVYTGHGDLIMMKMDGQYGYIDKKGNQIWPKLNGEKSQSSANVNSKKQYNHDLDQQLVEAVESRDTQKVKTLLSAGADPNGANDKGFRALPKAALMGTAETVQVLLEAGADVNAKDAYYESSLIAAADDLDDEPELIKILLAAGAKIDKRTSTNDTALIEAASLGKLKTVKILLEAGADVNAKDNGGFTALMRTCDRGEGIDVVKALLDAGADVNIKGDKGESALKLEKDPDVAALLRQHGASE